MLQHAGIPLPAHGMLLICALGACSSQAVNVRSVIDLHPVQLARQLNLPVAMAFYEMELLLRIWNELKGGKPHFHTPSFQDRWTVLAASISPPFCQSIIVGMFPFCTVSPTLQFAWFVIAREHGFNQRTLRIWMSVLLRDQVSCPHGCGENRYNALCLSYVFITRHAKCVLTVQLTHAIHMEWIVGFCFTVWPVPACLLVHCGFSVTSHSSWKLKGS